MRCRTDNQVCSLFSSFHSLGENGCYQKSVEYIIIDWCSTISTCTFHTQNKEEENCMYWINSQELNEMNGSRGNICQKLWSNGYGSVQMLQTCGLIRNFISILDLVRWSINQSFRKFETNGGSHCFWAKYIQSNRKKSSNQYSMASSLILRLWYLNEKF